MHYSTFRYVRRWEKEVKSFFLSFTMVAIYWHMLAHSWRMWRQLSDWKLLEIAVNNPDRQSFFTPLVPQNQEANEAGWIALWLALIGISLCHVWPGGECATRLPAFMLNNGLFAFEVGRKLRSTARARNRTPLSLREKWRFNFEMWKRRISSPSFLAFRCLSGGRRWIWGRL